MGNWYYDYGTFYDLAEIVDKLRNDNDSNRAKACYAWGLMEDYRMQCDCGDSCEELKNILELLKENLTEETKEEYKCYINELEEILK